MINVGLSEAISTTVTDADTAIALGSGDVAVLGTPRVVALLEEAAIAALVGSLPAGATTVGTNITINHMAASAVGATVSARATVVGVQGKKILFDIELTEGDTLAAKGTHTRVIVDRATFEGDVY
jgi:predicted thioesterase